MEISIFIMGRRPPPQNSAKAKKLGGDQLPKSDCSTNNQWG